ncbi:lipoprotein [Streptomyces griseocarneus]|nr:lipoprotein [Streptomyces griseocarneus]
MAGGAAVLLAGCSGGGNAGEDAADERSPAAERLRARAGRDAAGLLQRYDATIAAHATLGERLRPLRAEVARHVTAFAPAAARSAAPSASPSASASPPPVRPEVPGDEEAALGALADAERRAADARTADLGSAPPQLARLLASVAAAGAAHAYLLTGGGS